MPAPDLAVLADGDLSTGEHWILRAGGTSTDFYTFLETVHPDGHRDEGGMGGPPLYPGSLLNIYTGGSERGLRRVVVRADPRVARVRVHLASGEPLDYRRWQPGRMSACRCSPPCCRRPRIGLGSPPSARKARSSNRRTWPTTRQAGSASRRHGRPQARTPGPAGLGPRSGPLPLTIARAADVAVTRAHRRWPRRAACTAGRSLAVERHECQCSPR